MNHRTCILSVLAAVIFFMAGAANGEVLKNLEYGISFDYADDLTPDMSGDVKTIYGTDGVIIDFFGVKISKNLGTIQDLANSLEKILSPQYSDFQISDGKEVTIDGIKGIAKQCSFNTKDSQGDVVAKKGKVIYLKNDNYLIYLFLRANDYYYDKADKFYFTPLVDSLKIEAVDETQEENIPGFPKLIAKMILSSPIFADITGDKSLEVIACTNERKLYAWSKDGKIVKGFPFKAEDAIVSSPAAGDINGDGKSEIVFGSDDKKLYVLNGNGSLLSGFPKITEGAIRSSPALGDLDGDGALEIAVGSLDSGLYAIKRDGKLVCGFPAITGQSTLFLRGIWSSPAIGDINGDSRLEVVVGTTKYEWDLSSEAGKQISSGRVFAVNGKGETIEGFPSSLGEGNQIGYSSPVLADINGNGKLEIIVGAKDGLHCLNAVGDSEPGFPVETGGPLQDNFIAVGDLEGDGKLEIVSGCPDGKLYAWRNDGSNYPGFPIQTGGWLRHISLADIDKDGKQEILGGSNDNRVHAWKLDGSEAKGFPKVTMGNVGTAPTVGDLEGDGTLELAIASNDGNLYVWRISQSYGKLDWPVARQNPQHTGVFGA
jgi:WD40 repeat protein